LGPDARGPLVARQHRPRLVSPRLLTALGSCRSSSVPVALGRPRGWLLGPVAGAACAGSVGSRQPYLAKILTRLGRIPSEFLIISSGTKTLTLTPISSKSSAAPRSAFRPILLDTSSRLVYTTDLCPFASCWQETVSRLGIAPSSHGLNFWLDWHLNVTPPIGGVAWPVMQKILGPIVVILGRERGLKFVSYKVAPHKEGVLPGKMPPRCFRWVG
jgi:hypothetical protein